MEDGGKVNGGRFYGSKYAPAIIAVVGAILGSSGTVAVVFNTPFGQQITRPDPFTGTEAVALEQRIEHVEEAIDRHIGAHPSTVNQFDRRIATLEAQYAIILQNQGRILDRLDAM